MNLEEYKGVFVFAQQVDNKVSGIALELDALAICVGDPFKPRLESSTSFKSALPHVVISALYASKIPPGVI